MSLILEDAVWAKCQPAYILGPDYGYDAYGNVIYRWAHGDQKHPYGWQMDHHPVPACLGGPKTLGNLRPLHHKQNASNGGILGSILNSPSNALSGLLDQQPYKANGLFGSKR
jgi:hypothetical protein